MRGIVKTFRIWFYNLRLELYFKKLRRRMQRLNNTLPDSSENKELKNALAWYQNNPISVFPYDFLSQYDKLELSVNREGELPFIVWDNKKIFFKEHWSDSQIVKYFRTLVAEQDVNSPHRYLSPDFDIDSETTLIDIGVAEGNFSISVVERVKRVLIFEYDQGWLKALDKTFFPYSSSVKIYKNKVGDKTSEETVALDDLKELLNEKVFIKIDVDGDERKVLAGMKNLISKSLSIKIAICTYHNQEDGSEFESFFKMRGFQTSFSKGYMLFHFDKKKMHPPFLRRGVLRAEKCNFSSLRIPMCDS